ncbi:uncharacterized protein METZ01_LOCUS472147, partial [marine metagenome]
KHWLERVTDGKMILDIASSLFNTEESK